jgi:hypothetical protein
MRYYIVFSVDERGEAQGGKMVKKVTKDDMASDMELRLAHVELDKASRGIVALEVENLRLRNRLRALEDELRELKQNS